ncbi:MFS transporter [bacterium]|nr:MFS transporter [bacterium]
MPETSTETYLPAPQLKRAWSVVTLAGCLGAVYFLICVGGVPRMEFLRIMGATPFHFGVIAALGSLSISFQILSGILTNRMTRRRTFWITITAMHRLIFVLVLVSPWLFDGERIRLWWIIAIIFVHDALAHLGSPMWFSWMADLLPSEKVNRYWATRQRIVTATNIVAAILVAYLYDLLEKRDMQVGGFVILAAFGIVVGVVDILLFRLVPEPPNERVQDPHILQTLLQPLRDKEFRPFLIFMAYWTFSAAMAWPFFGLYALEVLKLSVFKTQIMFMTGGLGVLISSRYAGLLCDTYGQKPILQIALAGKAVVPLTFLLVPPIAIVAVPVIATIMFFDGMLNSAFALSTQGVMLKHTPRRNRSMYIAATNFIAVGITGALASFFSGYLIDALKELHWQPLPFWVFTGFHVAFLLSAVLRIGANKLVTRLHDPHAVPTRTVLSHLRVTNPLKVTRAVYQLHTAETDEERIEAARRLAHIGSPLVIRQLIPLLQDESRPVRRAVADALGEIASGEACEPLTKALFDPESGIQPWAARALGRIGGVQSVQALLSALQKLDSATMGEAVDSLANIGDSSAILPLICLYQDVEDRPLRRRIAAALGRLSETKTEEEVMALLNPARPHGAAAPRP